MVNGLFHGFGVFFEIPPPQLLQTVFPFGLAFLGMSFAFFLLRILHAMARAAFDRRSDAEAGVVGKPAG